MLYEKPRKGQRIRFRTLRGNGTIDSTRISANYEVTEVHDRIAWIKRPGEPATCFIWCFADGALNNLAEVVS